MSASQILTKEELMNVLAGAVQEKTHAVMTYQAKGKWHTKDVMLQSVNSVKIQLQISGHKAGDECNFCTDQPVGISLATKSDKYIFEAVLCDHDSNYSDSGTAVITVPERMEKLQRRSDERVDVPSSLNVKVLFWHRGYCDDGNEGPAEAYWQGRLVDLSVSGMQISLSKEQSPNFKVGQLVGLQFTPMPYQKPIMIEGRLKHIGESDDGAGLCLGIQALGLEATSQGREKLRRIVSVLDEYNKTNERQVQQAAAEFLEPQAPKIDLEEANEEAGNHKETVEQ